MALFQTEKQQHFMIHTAEIQLQEDKTLNS